MRGSLDSRTWKIKKFRVAIKQGHFTEAYHEANHTIL
jgi:hypothetical protein